MENVEFEKVISGFIDVPSPRFMEFNSMINRCLNAVLFYLVFAIFYQLFHLSLL